MFQIIAATMLFVITIGFPPAALITIPVALIWLDARRQRNAKARRELDVDLPSRRLQEKAQQKALRSW